MSTAKITGGVKFFDRNFALLREKAAAIASSNTDSINFVLDISRYTQWESIGSSDIVEETITVTFPFSKTIDTIFLADMNFKDFSVQYFNGVTFVDFANVFGVNNESKTGINETGYAYDTGFYQFDEVSTLQIQIKCLTTQTVDAQKFLGQIIATYEIGTFQGFPRIKSDSNRNETSAKALSRRYVVQKTYETNTVNINFKTHPFQNDIDIANELFNREEPFLVYPCGGRTGSPYFKIEQKNWRLNDIYNVQILGKMKNDFEKGVYSLGVNKSLRMVEHI